ncbi:MAG TPA: hypothetical protein PLQ60_04610 [Paludibacteraceae bacterium]|nr:hypothetical protein [Paludibacteraceae bacterium]
MKIFKTFIFFVLLTLVFIGCDNSSRSSIPDAPVNLQLNMLVAPYNTFNTPNSYLIFDKRMNEIDRIGYGGILLYIDYEGKYCAFDLACPYEVNPNVKVTPNDEGKAVCEKCGSVFELLYGIGAPISGPAKEPLKRYHVYLSNNWLYVTN